MSQFSFLKKKLEDLFCPELKVQFYANAYKIGRSSCPMVRYHLTLHSEVIWDFPKHFEEIRKKSHHHSYFSGYQEISELIKDYVNTPVTELLVKEYKDNWFRAGTKEPAIHLGLVELFLACDRRLGKERLLTWAKQIIIPTVHEILKRRFNQWGTAECYEQQNSKQP